jgi:two-component system, chemotaxis family, sensor kinase CheA
MDNAERALLQLETDPEDMEAINTVFRAFHTVKSTSSYLNLSWICELAHKAESVLSRMRDREIRCAGQYADLALRSVDMAKSLLQSIQKAVAGEAMTKPDEYDSLLAVLTNPLTDDSTDAGEDPGPTLRVGDVLVAMGKVSREEIEAIEKSKGDVPLGKALVESNIASTKDVAQALRIQRKISGKDSMESTIRVSTARLDQLIEMIGELVIAQSMVSQDKLVVSGAHYDLARKVAHAGKIVRELQDLSMSMRMVPLKGTFQKVDRLVRDLAHKTGKSIALETEDRDTEIDRNMVDVINDLVVHMVRNAADHGIETAGVRAGCGKSETGTISLSASQSGGNVLLEIRDDGKGLDRDRIVEKAIAKGLIQSGKGMSDDDVFNLIFEPGFSTAENISDISGRGVGMDVVKRGVESLRGRIQISSTAGRGTLFSVRLPLTLAITDGMLVRVGTERYIIPTVNIHIAFRPKAEDLATLAGKGEMVLLRGDLLPIFRLHRIYQVADAIQNPTEGLLVAIADRDRKYALLVDELLGQHQVVAKSLPCLGNIPGVSGGAILADGCVGLIIDPAQVVAFGRSAGAAAGITAA